MRFAPWYYSLLGSVVWFCVLADCAPSDEVRVLYLGGAALGLTAAVYLLRVEALAVYAQCFLGLAFFVWVLSRTQQDGGQAAASVGLNTTLCLLIIAVALGQWWRRLPGRALWTAGPLSRFFSAGDAILATGAAWFELSSRLERWHGAGFTLAAGWSGFAAFVFVSGLLLHQRVYRWLGLLIMAATCVRLVVFDIMELDSGGKAISFAALAAVLLGVGFLYNKYQDKFRDLL